MNDDLLARADGAHIPVAIWHALPKKAQDELADLIDLIRDLAAALRVAEADVATARDDVAACSADNANLRAEIMHLEADLAAARTVTRRFINAWTYDSVEEDSGTWYRDVLPEAVEEEVISDAERAWLTSVASTSTTTEDP